MKTDDLIEALAVGLEPARPARLDPLLLAAAGIVAVAAVLLLMGGRSDLNQALVGTGFWLKLLYTVALAASAGWLAFRLGRPGVSATPAWLALGGVFAIAAATGMVEMVALPADDRARAWLGDTWRVCAANILIVAAVASPLTFVAARRLAPTRPVAAGAAVGLMTGAIGATAYGLHCPETTAAFVATWYTLGVVLAGGVGAAVGRFVLRW